jgi:iron complex transport system ATP-binding protein
MIGADRLTLRLGGRTVLDDINFALECGRMTAIIGPNGAGKTSLIRALAGLLPGPVQLDGQPLAALSLVERARRIGYLPQDGEPAWNVTARELVALGRLPHRSRLAAPSTADAEAISAAIAATDTMQFADRTIDTLSGGERARVKMARVLAGEPDWILVDEPLANLDPPHQRDFLALLRAAAANGKGIVAVLHQLDAAALADDVLILKEGRIVAFGPARDVVTPSNLETAFEMAFDVIAHHERIAILPRA